MSEEEIKIGNELILKFMSYEFNGKYWIKEARRFPDIDISKDWGTLIRVLNKCYIISNEKYQEKYKKIQYVISVDDFLRMDNMCIFEEIINFINNLKDE